MPTVKLRDDEALEVAFRRFKRLCEKSGIFSKLRQIEFYEKPTSKKKRKRSAAVKRQQKRTTYAANSGFFRHQKDNDGVRRGPLHPRTGTTLNKARHHSSR